MSASAKALDALEKFPGSDCRHAKANEACDCAVDTVADIAAPLAAVARAAMAWRKGEGAATWSQGSAARLEAALDALEAAAAEGGGA